MNKFLAAYLGDHQAAAEFSVFLSFLLPCSVVCEKGDGFKGAQPAFLLNTHSML